MWRSMLFVPALEEKYIGKAGQTDADVLIVDLEAAVSPTRKAEARARLPEVIHSLTNANQRLCVRINCAWREAFLDLEVVVGLAIQAIVIPRVAATHVRALDGYIRELEILRGVTPGHTALIAMIETPQTLIRAHKLTKASPRLLGLALGVEDFATEMQAPAEPTLLMPAVLQVCQAAHAAELMAWGVPCSIADFDNLDAFEEAARQAKAYGATGGYAIHPRQVAVLNRVFSPSAAEIADAQDVLACAEQAQAAGRGIGQVDGRMVDLPIVKRAQNILALAERNK